MVENLKIHSQLKNEKSCMHIKKDPTDLTRLKDIVECHSTGSRVGAEMVEVSAAPGARAENTLNGRQYQQFIHVATLFYCCAVTVFEWNCGHVFVLPPIANLGSLIIHCSISPGYKNQIWSKPRPYQSSFLGEMWQIATVNRLSKEPEIASRSLFLVAK